MGSPVSKPDLSWAGHTPFTVWIFQVNGGSREKRNNLKYL
jgi:hypothetical protein